MNSPFFSLAPKRSLDEDLIATEIEISFFMKFLLDLDFLATGDYDERPRGGWTKHIRSRVPITEHPQSPKYPKPYTSHMGWDASLNVRSLIASRASRVCG